MPFPSPRPVRRQPGRRRPRLGRLRLTLAVALLVPVLGATSPAQAAPPVQADSYLLSIGGSSYWQRAHFVNATYRSFGVGNASLPDIITWSQLLRKGFPRSIAADNATNDDWWRGTLVDDAYMAVLGRHPSAASSIARVKALARGGTRNQLYASLYSSSEFFWVTSSGKVPTFLGRLYAGVLNHPPSASAVAAWTKRLADGWPRATVVSTIITSAAARGVRVDDDYATFLHRAPSPELRARRVAELGGEDELVLQKQLATSDEFFSVAQTVPLPPGTVAPPNPPNTTGGRALAQAETQLGVTYVWGGETAGVGFDCSGLMQWAYARVGVKIPRTTYVQVNAPKRVSLSKIQPGDLVFYYDTGHVAMYVGNGLILHAPHEGTVVRFGYLNMDPPEHAVHPW